MAHVKSFNSSKFPEFPFFTYPALIFLDLGVLFGAFNSWRLAEIAGFGNIPEIHRTHWTTTLFGAMTLLMLGILYFIISQEHEDAPRMHKGMFLVLASLLGTITIGYLDAWGILSGDNPDLVYAWALRVTIVIFVIIVLSSLLDSGFISKIKETPELWLVLSAIVWFAISGFFFNYDRAYIHQLFKAAFIFGFFSLTLFGSLSYLLPILFQLKRRTKSALIRDLIMFNLAPVVFLIDEYLDVLEKDTPFIIELLGPALWGFATFLFILWVFDLMFRTGTNLTLSGLLIALVMFGFFVFDAFMKNVFPHWVSANHVHFMFLGTLVMTIISIGLQVIVRQHNYEIPESMPGWISLGKKVGIGLVLFGVVGVLTSFTLPLVLGYEAAGYFGLIIFGSLLFAEAGYILETTKYVQKA